jgi:hypothetical protein
LIPAVSNSPDHDLSRRDAIKRLAAAGATLRGAHDGGIAE